MKYEQMNGQSDSDRERVMAKLTGRFLKLLVEDAPQSTKSPIVITFTKINFKR